MAGYFFDETTPNHEGNEMTHEARLIHMNCWALFSCVLMPGVALATSDESTTEVVEVVYTTRVCPAPFSGRVYLFLEKEQLSSRGDRQPRFGPDWVFPEPFCSLSVSEWRAGAPIVFNADSASFPRPLNRLEPGTYRAQAVMRLNPDTHAVGTGEGNAYSTVVQWKVGAGGDRAPVPRLTIDQVNPPREFEQTSRIRLVKLRSQLLSEFFGRPIFHQASVIFPLETGKTGRAPPILYIAPGFGGDHHNAQRYIQDPRYEFGSQFLRVVLSPDCGSGHHAFADSDNNGPRGKAFVEELIPWIEEAYGGRRQRAERLLQGHSSGGWSALWLQTHYPELFRACWATAPDPVDFRAFDGVNIYQPGASLFVDAAGAERPIVRIDGKVVTTLRNFSRRCDVLAEGSQMWSFEAVFSPRGAGGQPIKLWDRESGRIDGQVAEAWRRYDIREHIESNWRELSTSLQGALHIYVGDRDEYYLNEPVKLLRDALHDAHCDAVVEILPDKGHHDLFDRGFVQRLDREMTQVVNRSVP